MSDSAATPAATLTTAEALRRYHDELISWNNDVDAVRALVEDAARQIVRDSGLCVRDN